jgi:acyl carrier protein
MSLAVLVKTIAQILQERGDPVPRLAEDTPLRETGLDSLDMAALVARLEDALGVDPFEEWSTADFPQTVGELAALYESPLGR